MSIEAGKLCKQGRDYTVNPRDSYVANREIQIGIDKRPHL